MCVPPVDKAHICDALFELRWVAGLDSSLMVLLPMVYLQWRLSVELTAGALSGE